MAVKIVHADCRISLRQMKEDGVQFHACVTDPPYELGFMGKKWDASGVAFQPETWRAVYEVLLPGAYLLAFGGTRTFHRMACAIEDAGFEIRDTLCWLYGMGFPKSLDVSKAIDKAAGNFRGRNPDLRNGTNTNHSTKGRPAIVGGYAGTKSIDAGPLSLDAAQWQGWGTALKPAHEPIILARKPLIGTVAANVLAHGTGAINIDACRVPASSNDIEAARVPNPAFNSPTGKNNAMKCSEGRNGETHDMSKGRWPANVLHDGSDEVEAAFAAFGERPTGKLEPHHTLRASENDAMSGSNQARNPRQSFGGDSGTASRFFYSAKATAADRSGSKHPTVKPTALMQWLVRLITPPTALCWTRSQEPEAQVSLPINLALMRC